MTHSLKRLPVKHSHPGQFRVLKRMARSDGKGVRSVIGPGDFNYFENFLNHHLDLVLGGPAESGYGELHLGRCILVEYYFVHPQGQDDGTNGHGDLHRRTGIFREIDLFDGSAPGLVIPDYRLQGFVDNPEALINRLPRFRLDDTVIDYGKWIIDYRPAEDVITGINAEYSQLASLSFIIISSGMS